MEDGVPEAETLLRPTSLSEDKAAIGETENPQGEESERPTGFINHFISNLVTGGGGDADEENEPDGGKKEEQGGGILDHIISNLVGEETKTEKTEEGEGGGGGFIDNIVSHLPTSLPDDAAPTTDEATILIHIVQD
ncbi:hypothetical protein CCACVL1_10510 [Corchorus capsularis]|uniref:Uncharacterized protein n=1 Tax=Corchorus capsularis TaxID=210143 RepID=A0A1R3IQV9_COCAP|nr:hypothetical protein CCACVL1_10510 [Corchorus capsularis]